MHIPDSTPRASLYYDYRVHSPWLASQHPAPAKPRVVIAGAGPVGLAFALALAHQGMGSIVLESELQVSEGSRAIVFTRRSMEILQQVGVAEQVLARCLPWRCGNSYYRGHQVYRMEAPHSADERFHPMNNLQQQVLEELLLDAVAREPLIELRWGNRLTGLHQTPAQVQLEIDTPEGTYSLASDWLVAADGARSTVRTLLDVKLEGTAYEGRFVIADIRIDLPLPTERLAFFDPAWNPGNTVLMHREPQDIWRVDYQLPQDQSPEEALEPAVMRSRINAQLASIGHADTPWELDWCSVYSARALTLPDYRHGRTLFVGDAAHLLPIFGVRGANTGFQDAQALAWRLALVTRGVAPEGLLASYSHERVGAAREIIEEAGKSTRFMSPPSRGFRLLRDAVLSLSLSQPFVGPLFHWRTSRAHDYRDSPLNSREDDDAGFALGPGHGAPVGNLRLGEDDYLLDHLGGGFDLLVFAPKVAADVLAVVEAAIARGLSLRVIGITAQGAVAGATTSLVDAAGGLSSHFGVTASGAAYLLRPDQHVCARWQSVSGAQLERALQRATGAET